MEDSRGIFLGAHYQKKSNELQSTYIWLKYANRHGLITGATGTGKTVTLQVLAESFSVAGIPVFCADVKGDLSGIAKAGVVSDKIKDRAIEVGLKTIKTQKSPVIFWDLLGDQGHPIRTTVTEIGPFLLSRMLDLTPAQEGVLNIAFSIADEEKRLLIDLKDLKAMLMYAADHASEFSTRYGNISRSSVGAIQRQLLILETQGGSHFFGEPALQLRDLMRTQIDGRGFVNVLAADKIMSYPRLYSTFLFWLMSKLFEQLPEIDDPDKLRLAFFFDEAHFLFNNASKSFIEKIEQTVRLIRSKGVGIYFISQSPLDIPEAILAQLGNRIQHALRAYTPREIAAVKTIASTFRANSQFDTMEAIGQLSTGEALVSTLEKKAVPSVVQRTIIRPPWSQIGSITFDERKELIASSPVFGQYEQTIDRDSAYETLLKSERAEINVSKKGSHQKSVADAVTKAVMRSATNSLGRFLVKAGENVLRNILRNILGKNRKR
ncbi:helicase HerA-like domain-containing protein [Bartonella sp. F02]|uniref:helicase HerA-like domain-containing protein n=1 Tax=Bartonella sp. F02 TaxID=2967262 RepID=UPI0022A8FDF4|nr:helicase HerA-like domain-containing protein [Bartonella sp. F02]MCZ2328491.1 DUF853 domain-containing protein [Bartonella sp. F02]